MKIDFARTKADVRDCLQKTLSEFSKKHPRVQVKKLALWGYGFGKVVKVTMETSDDDAVFGGVHGEYAAKEVGPGVTFDSFWPDFYAVEDSEPYEITLEDGTVTKTYQSKVGNDAIDKPLFKLLQEVLAEADLASVNKTKSLKLAVEMGCSGLQKAWKYKPSAV